ncbi:DUF2931 family protein [Pseudomonas sp. MG-9]|uniref:DUF2931 family protein n=1 Tax=Pseudomonas sp. MG-9 TaxID=2839032 RepID=UPI001C000A8E|nr:DUF2931 family protein [Pseudomonas sp. MG-9]MBT9264382.1 DUF2931 family protein [Pseudomonas sp. MG-9]
MVLGKDNPAITPRKPTHRIKRCISLFSWLLLAGCTQSHAQSTAKLPWFLGFSAPAYMEVWIETADVVDIKERVFQRAGSGIASVPTPPDNQGKARDWVSNNGAGKGKYVTGADLPRLIYVRWQSLAEPQTYEAYIVIPESAREIMRKPEKAFCNFGAEWITESRDNIGIGLAPGGIVKAWLAGACLKAIEITRVEGNVVKQGPYQGENGGRYALPMSSESKAYIDKFGVPYGSW